MCCAACATGKNVTGNRCIRQIYCTLYSILFEHALHYVGNELHKAFFSNCWCVGYGPVCPGAEWRVAPEALREWAQLWTQLTTQDLFVSGSNSETTTPWWLYSAVYLISRPMPTCQGRQHVKSVFSISSKGSVCWFDLFIYCKYCRFIRARCEKSNLRHFMWVNITQLNPIL